VPDSPGVVLVRHRISRYRWFARRYRDEAAEELYHAEEAHRSEDSEFERIHREGVACALKIARFFEAEAASMEERLQGGTD
jgi:hypothetical protein